MNMFEQSHIIQCAPHEIIQFNNNLNLSLDKYLSKVLKVSAEQKNKSNKEVGTDAVSIIKCIKCSKISSFCTCEMLISFSNEQYNSVRKQFKLFENDFVENAEELLVYLSKYSNPYGRNIIDIIQKGFKVLKDENSQTQDVLKKNLNQLNECKTKAEFEINRLNEKISKMSSQMDQLKQDLSNSNDQLKFFLNQKFLFEQSCPRINFGEYQTQRRIKPMTIEYCNLVATCKQANEKHKIQTKAKKFLHDYESERKFPETSMNTSQIFSFDASYEPIATGQPPSRPKPDCIASLNLNKVLAYKSNSGSLCDLDFIQTHKMHFDIDPELILRKNRSFDDIFLVIETDDA